MSSTEASSSPGLCPLEGQIFFFVSRNSLMNADNNISGELALFHLVD